MHCFYLTVLMVLMYNECAAGEEAGKYIVDKHYCFIFCLLL